MRFLVLFMTIFLSSLVWAQAAPPETVDGLALYLGQIIDAVGKGDWNVIGGFLLMGVMAAVRQFVLPKAKLDPSLIPLINVLISGLAFAGLAAVSSGVDLGEALKAAVLTSGVAAIAWELVGKLVFKFLGIDSYKKPL